MDKPRISIAVQKADFDVGALTNALFAADANQGITSGAVANFVGVVRTDGQVRAMTLEHYPGMTEKALREIVEQACARWAINAISIIHRVGKLHPADKIVFVGVATSHRHDAFAACEFVMDFLKTRAPFWKKEETAQGARWVDARESDEAALQRWTEQ